MRKLVSSQKAQRKKIKSRTENSTGNADKKKSTKTGQNDKTKKRHWNMQRQKRKGNTRKNNNIT